MTKVMINARNSRDGSLRTWGLFVDEVPQGNWRKNTSAILSSRREADPWDFDLSLEDGKHVLYFIVSQTEPNNGGYDGEALIGQAGFNFKGVDNDTVAKFNVKSSGGKITRDQPGSAADSDDLDFGSSKLGSIKGAIGRLDLRKLSKAQQRALYAASGAVAVLAVGTFVTFKVLRKKRRF